MPDVATEADGDERRIRQMADAQSNVDAFVHQVDLAVEEEKLGRNGRMEVEEIVQDRPQHLLPADRRRRNGQHPTWRGALTDSEHVGFLEIDQHPPTGDCVAFSRFAQLERSSRSMQQLDADMGFQKGQRPADSGR